MTDLCDSSAITTFDQLAERLRAYQPLGDLDLLEKAYGYATRAHEGHTRKSGAPYFAHPAAVARVITDLRLDVVCVCAGLLHDVVEDTQTTVSDIEREFGVEIAFLVDGVTKLSKVYFASRQERDSNNFRKMLVAMSRDIRVLLVKLCDRVDNMRTLQFMKPEAQERIAKETEEMFAPLAGRLGLHAFQVELEDLAFRYLQPQAFAHLSRRVSETHPQRQDFIDKASAVLQSIIVDHGFTGCVVAKTKHLYSIHRQMIRQNVPFECLPGLVTFRLIMPSVTDCYSMLGAIHSRYTPVPGRIKDYIALPKPNMYQSLHTTVMGPERERVDIQIRTPEMEAVALKGIAAQWVYRGSNSGGPHPALMQRMSWLRDLMESQENIRDAFEFMDSIKVDLFQDEVYAFTPKGDVRVFPHGSTIVDFAYAIHSEVGHHAIGARINGGFVTLQHQLQNGDIVEILTSTDQKPKKEWLTFAASARARNRIRAYLRSDERQRALLIGKGLLDKTLHERGVSLERLMQCKPELDRVLGVFQMASIRDLLVAVGYGRVAVGDIVNAIMYTADASDSAQPVPSVREGRIEHLVRSISWRASQKLRLGQIGGDLLHYARCCSPLPGDEIVGIFTRRRGITVHRRDCAHAFETATDRRIPIAWDAEAKVCHCVQLNILTDNRKGLLGSMGQTFSDQDVNLTAVSSRATEDGRSVNVFTFMCEDLARLKAIMRALRQVQGVFRVDRV